MNPGNFFIPRMVTNFGPMMATNYLPSRGNIGLFSKITGSLRSFNWSNLLNGANKTLNVVNQTIPLVRQAGPMFNNMKSMMRIAKVFGSETQNKKKIKSNLSLGNSKDILENRQNVNVIKNRSCIIKNNENINSSYPNFFV